MNFSNNTVMDAIDTIAAIATPPGKGGVAILRVSGPQVKQIAKSILGLLPSPRYAHYGPFQHESELLDEGLALFFLGPHSFTGEDVLEFQAHGGPIVMQRLLKAVCSLGARIARPGEFTERAFLNGKIDLTQCEAIADLIDANSESAARAALSSLQGVFSAKVNQLVEAVVYLRMYVEAAIDFPEEEVDYLSDNKILNQLDSILERVTSVLKEAKQGVKLRQGFKIALIGKPNVGKSSLLNSLAGDDVAIVTAIAGTTRDWVKEDIIIDGLTIQVTDTAGIRKTDDIVEQKGIERSFRASEQADRVLLIVDGTLSPSAVMDEVQEIQELVSIQAESGAPKVSNITVVLNKMDLIKAEEARESCIGVRQQDGVDFVCISAQTGAGLDELRHYLKELASGSGIDGADGQCCAFTARARHVNALETAMTHLNLGREALVVSKAGELLAEELRLVQESLGEITGKFSTEDLLGRIFSSFCMGK